VAHLHTNPGDHDLTVSAYVVILDAVPRVLVHQHRLLGVLLQCGGHVEVGETPWAALAHELAEETGFAMDELEVLQPRPAAVPVTGAVAHPVPFCFETHRIGREHFHTDLAYALIARDEPASSPDADESQDLRWVTLAELRTLATTGDALDDVAAVYAAILTEAPAWHRIPANTFGTADPWS
jgi:8-oxo-dGTP diphosphatase